MATEGSMQTSKGKKEPIVLRSHDTYELQHPEWDDIFNFAVVSCIPWQ